MQHTWAVLQDCQKRVWHLHTLEKIKLLMWRICHRMLLTNKVTAKRGIGSKFYPFCSNVEELLLHVLRDCFNAKEAWKSLVLACKIVEFFFSGLQDWLNLNI